MEKDGAYKMDRQNKKCSCARKSGRRKNDRNDKEEEKKLAGPLAKKGLPAEGCSRTRVRKSGTLPLLGDVTSPSTVTHNVIMTSDYVF